MSSWAWLVAAGLVEVAWSQSLRPTHGFTRIGPSLVCICLGVTSVWLLTRAMAGLPVGTAYTVFTGIGAIGAVSLGVLWGGDQVTVGRVIGLTLIVFGIAVVRLSSA